MKLSHRMLRPSALIGLLAEWHDELVGSRGYLLCEGRSEGHSIFNPDACDFIMAKVSGANGEIFTVVPVPEVLKLPVTPGEQCAWEMNAGKFAVVVFPEEGDCDVFEGFASFGDALRFVAGVAPDQRSHWPLVIDAEVSYYLARDRMTGLEWPDDRI